MVRDTIKTVVEYLVKVYWNNAFVSLLVSASVLAFVKALNYGFSHIEISQSGLVEIIDKVLPLLNWSATISTITSVVTSFFRLITLGIKTLVDAITDIFSN